MCTYDSILIGAQTTSGTLSQQLLCFAIIQLTEGLVRWFDGNTEIIARKRRQDNQLDLLFFRRAADLGHRDRNLPEPDLLEVLVRRGQRAEELGRRGNVLPQPLHGPGGARLRRRN